MTLPPSAPAADRPGAAGPPAREPLGWPGWFFLALAAAGAVVPWLANGAFIRDYGAPLDLGLFLRLATANPAAQSLTADLAIGSTAVVGWMVLESRRLRMRGLPWVLLGCFTVAFAFGAPLFLYLRERRLRELGAEGQAPWGPSGSC
ncbi:MAG: DUF2834 domain-containing protein [Synechococcaceae cyanobacterium]|nr:DUF2834 domain-containing protein [Synechococcaceae cyanobacterium]